ncbi:MAG: hypothetical protein ABIF11_00495 [Nitrospirota bacterium]
MEETERNRERTEKTLYESHWETFNYKENAEKVVLLSFSLFSAFYL